MDSSVKMILWYLAVVMVPTASAVKPLPSPLVSLSNFFVLNCQEKISPLNSSTSVQSWDLARLLESIFTGCIKYTLNIF